MFPLFFLFLPLPKIIKRVFCALSSSMMLVYLTVCLMTYKVYHFQINALFLKMIFSKAVLQVFELSMLELGLAIAVIIVLFVRNFSLVGQK